MELQKFRLFLFFLTSQTFAQKQSKNTRKVAKNSEKQPFLSEKQPF